MWNTVSVPSKVPSEWSGSSWSRDTGQQGSDGDQHAKPDSSGMDGAIKPLEPVGAKGRTPRNVPLWYFDYFKQKLPKRQLAQEQHSDPLLSPWKQVINLPVKRDILLTRDRIFEPRRLYGEISFLWIHLLSPPKSVDSSSLREVLKLHFLCRVNSSQISRPFV